MARPLRLLGLTTLGILAACHPADAPKVVATDDAGADVMAPLPPTPPAALNADFDAQQKRAAQSNPSDLHFTIRLADGKTRFLQGEPITIELAFASDVPNKYKLDKGLYDRSGRMSCDDWILDRTDTVDPLAEYFAGGFGGMGGLRQMPILGAKPETLGFALNEWHRFDRPGHYRLYVTSRRIELDGADGGTVSLSPTSNVIEFDVALPTAVDASRLLADAVALADAKSDDDRRKGMRALRFLGSEGALGEMIRRFDDDMTSSEWELGIIGSPHRATALAQMEARLDDDVAIPTRFLYTLALLRDRTDAPTAKYDWPARQKILQGYAGRLAGALTRRGPHARAVSTATVLDIAWTGGGPEPAWVGTALATLPSVFHDLPIDQQLRILEYRWKRAKDPALAQPLRELYDDPKSNPDQREAALHRLLELDPAGARSRILDRLRTGTPALGYRASRTMGALPDATLPALDGALADRVEKDPSAITDVARYATAAIAARVKHVYAAKAGSFATDLEGDFIAYFLRVDPAFAEKAAAALVTGKHGGAGSALKRAADRQMTPGFEKVLVAALASPNVETVIGAVEALEHHGSAAAQAALWKRLDDFHATWVGHESDLAYSVTGGLKNSDAVRLETALWRAIAHGHGWLCDRAGLLKLQTLVVRKEEKEQVGYEVRWWEAGFRIELNRGDDGEYRGRVAQYEVTTIAELEARLALFAKGTAFGFGTIDAADRPRIEAKLTGLGMKIVP